MEPTKVICPCCGAEFALPENEHFAAGIAIGKDSGLGTIQLPLDKEGEKTPKGTNKAEARLEALRAAGVDTSGLFSLKGAAGEGLLVRTGEDGRPEIVPDDDPIFNAILRGGTIPERRLFRRWIMAQIFRTSAKDRDGFNKYVSSRDCRYAFSMLLDEMTAQQKMKGKDKENYKMRNRWFNAELVAQMFADYKKKLTALVQCSPAQYDKEKMDCLHTIEGKIYSTLELNSILDAIDTLTCQVMAKPGTCVGAIKEFMSLMPARKLKTAKAWKDAFKGAGAYFTLRNLILFHGCVLHDSNQKPIIPEMSLARLESLAAKYSKGNGWKLLSRLFQEIDLNGIDINAKRAEWAENARLRKELSKEK